MDTAPLPPSAAADPMVIVGDGECGALAALTLRQRGWPHGIVLIGEEPVGPYERPALSKPADDGTPWRPMAESAQLAEAGITLQLGTAVTAIDRGQRTLRLADGRRLRWHRLLLATGAVPRPLAVPGGARARVLRTLADAQALFEAARALSGAAAGTSAAAVVAASASFAPAVSRAPVSAPAFASAAAPASESAFASASAPQAVIVGGGLIGLESAALLRGLGLGVTVVETGPALLGRAVPAALARRLQALHEAAGVQVITGAAVEAVTADSVQLRDGRQLPAACVLAAIGVQPATALAEAAGLTCADGIVVDARLATADPTVYAAGDCAAVQTAPDTAPQRSQSWRAAREQGVHAAGAVGGEAAALVQRPWFWSDQLGHGLQVAGRPEADRPWIERPSGPGATLLLQLDGEGRLAAAAGLAPGQAIARDIRLLERLMDADIRPDPAVLADAAVPLKSLWPR
ncbi:MAG: hypothetical protein RIQ53_1274 [Pseudomonadota bacterium]